MASSEKPSESRRAYHHGDLRRALLEKGVEALREVGVQGLSLRDVARRAGVTHAAPYRHFASKEVLLAAIAEQGFLELRAVMERSAKGARDGLDRLTRIGRGYVRFAEGFPDHLMLMFQRRLFEADYPPLREAGRATFEVLVHAVQGAQAEGALEEGDPTELALAHWSLVHGLSVLAIQGALEPMGLVARGPDQAAKTAIRWLQAGAVRRR